MLVSVRREDAARLLVESVRYAVGRTGAVVESVCEAGEQLLRALTIAEADAVSVAIAEQDRGGATALGEQGDRDRWQRLRRQLLDRTITGAPEQVPLIGRDLAILCACAERRAEALEPAAAAELQLRIARCREVLSPEDEPLALLELDADEPTGVAGSR